MWTRTHLAALLAALFAVAVVACKSKTAPGADAAAVSDGAAAAGSARAPASSVDASVAAINKPLVTVSAIAVSSRVENDSEKPGQIADGDLDTAWSSKTGDLEGAWVQMLIRTTAPGTSIAALHMTVGLTKKADDDDGAGAGDAFLQSPRIAEVSLAWAKELDAQLQTFAAEENLGGPANIKLDTESRTLQRIPLSVKGTGLLRITIKKLKMGTKPTAREASISEIELESDTGARFKSLKPSAAYVGTISDPKPRGILGIVPEKAPPFGCHVLVPTTTPPRLYCVLGFTTNVANNRGNAGELVTLDKSGTKTLGTLIDEDGQFHLPYALWLRTEKDLKTAQARPLNKTDAKAIPWNGSLDLGGATFRQRETDRDPKTAKDGDLLNILNGVLEVRWPGTDAFVPIFRAWPGIPPTTMMNASVRPLDPVGTLILVERSMHHASTSTTSRGGEASICDLSTKKCTAYQLPTPETIEEK